MEKETISWSALEYEEKERSVDWFWALGVIVVAGSIASIIWGNYFFAILLILSGLLLGYFAIKKPENIFYEMNSKGLQIKTRIFPYEDIKAFWIQESPKETLFIKSSRMFAPMLSIPITKELGEQIKTIMFSKNIQEEEMKEHFSEKIMENLGF